MPRADLGATEQEVGEREHLLVLVPVQSCFAMLQRKAYDEYGHLGEKSFEDAHPNLHKGSLTHHGHLVVNVLHSLLHVVFHAQETHEEVLHLLLVDDTIVVPVD